MRPLGDYIILATLLAILIAIIYLGYFLLKKESIWLQVPGGVIIVGLILSIMFILLGLLNSSETAEDKVEYFEWLIYSDTKDIELYEVGGSGFMDPHAEAHFTTNPEVMNKIIDRHNLKPCSINTRNDYELNYWEYSVQNKWLTPPIVENYLCHSKEGKNVFMYHNQDKTESFALYSTN
jgi:hypothetical protein